MPFCVCCPGKWELVNLPCFYSRKWTREREVPPPRTVQLIWIIQVSRLFLPDVSSRKDSHLDKGPGAWRMPGWHLGQGNPVAKAGLLTSFPNKAKARSDSPVIQPVARAQAVHPCLESDLPK